MKKVKEPYCDIVKLIIAFQPITNATNNFILDNAVVLDSPL